MAKSIPPIEITTLIDALVDAVAGKELQARLDVQIAIFNHTMASIVEASHAAVDQSNMPRRIMRALVRGMDDALADDWAT